MNSQRQRAEKAEATWSDPRTICRRLLVEHGILQADNQW